MLRAVSVTRGPRRRGFAGVLVLALSSALFACASASPLAPAARAVETTAANVRWQPAHATSIPGTYRSETIEGAAAPSVIGLYYHFEADRSYAAAALLASHPPAFQVRNGTWSLDQGKLSLGDGSEPAVIEEAEGRLRLTTSQGRVVLHRDEIR